MIQNQNIVGLETGVTGQTSKKGKNDEITENFLYFRG